MREDHDTCKNCDQPIRRDRYPNGEVGVWVHAATERIHHREGINPTIHHAVIDQEDTDAGM